MATTTRFDVETPDGSDANDFATDLFNIAEDITSKMAGYDDGLASARPAAGEAGRDYYATDTKVLSRDLGSAWANIPIVPDPLTPVMAMNASAKFSGAGSDFGGGAIDGTGPYLRIGDLADPDDAGIEARGDNLSNVGLKFLSKGAGIIAFSPGGTQSVVFPANSTDVAASVGTGDLDLTGGIIRYTTPATTATATAGGGSLPAAPFGFLKCKINGVEKKIPLYNS